MIDESCDDLPIAIGDDKLFVFKFNKNGFDCNVVVSEEHKDFMVDYCKRHPKQRCSLLHGYDNDGNPLNATKPVRCEEFVNCFFPITREEAETLSRNDMNTCTLSWYDVFEKHKKDANKWCDLCEKYEIDWDW